MKLIKKFFPFTWFYIGWFGCVYLAKQDQAAWSLLFPLTMLTALFLFKELNLKNLALGLFLALIGVLFDQTLAFLDFIKFNEPGWILPLWLISIWLMFVLVIPQLVPVFFKRLWLAAALAAIMGPVSYASGKALGVMTLNGAQTFVLYALFWAIYFPLSIYLIEKNSASSKN